MRFLEAKCGSNEVCILNSDKLKITKQKNFILSQNLVFSHADQYLYNQQLISSQASKKYYLIVILFV